MAAKSERRAALEVVAAYHEAELADLLARVSDAIDQFRAGALDVFEVDRVVFQYSRAAKQLWTFCNARDVENTAAMLRDEPTIDWWGRAAPRTR